MTTTTNNRDAIVQFIRSLGLQAMSICGHVYFEFEDGRQAKVRTMAEARELLCDGDTDAVGVPLVE